MEVVSRKTGGGGGVCEVGWDSSGSGCCRGRGEKCGGGNSPTGGGGKRCIGSDAITVVVLMVWRWGGG